ncbi:Uma2 family endonuclease [Polyangium spumosum]|uniref:Uma2 family endonuclease n=1 Tax=Polyangium spumosum TaxID=889282 RepID=A0A6N7PNV0_9BACT|nr:Uma2 family endonuclease [Polyangium spumosum]MRG91825.1 Uma2 family endonuclease [Polyangium spumosum]
MGDPARKIPTFEELLAEIDRLPEYLSGEIIEPGVIRTMSRPDAPHRRAARECQWALRGASADVTGSGWWIEQEPAVRFGERLFNPDLAGWRVERCPDPPHGYPITLTPDWVCEVLSPSTARDDRKIKLPHYARSGVEWVWLIDPEIHLVEVFRAERQQLWLVTSAGEEETPRLPPFDLEINLVSFWIPRKPAEPPSP